MSKIQIILSFFSLVLLMSTTKNTVNEKDVFGTYGDLNVHFVTLNSNHTFEYANFLRHKKESFHGTWQLKEGIVLFEEINSRKSIPKKWMVLDNGTRLQTKKGLTTYTLGGNCK